MKEERVYRVAETYKKEAVPALVKKFGYKNVNEVPKLVKIVVNAGFGDIKDNSKSMQLATEELKAITGQAPVATKAKKSVANLSERVRSSAPRSRSAVRRCTTSWTS